MPLKTGGFIFHTESGSFFHSTATLITRSPIPSRLPNFFFDLSRLQNRYSLLTFLRFRWGESSGGASFFNEKSPKREYSLDIEQWKRGRLKFLLRLINIKISLKSEREHWKKLGVYEERILPVPEAHSGQIQPAITCRGKWLSDRIWKYIRLLLPL